MILTQKVLTRTLEIMVFQTKAAFSDLKKSYRRIVRGVSRAQAAYSFFLRSRVTTISFDA